jgi:hypothetical protein
MLNWLHFVMDLTCLYTFLFAGLLGTEVGIEPELCGMVMLPPFNGSKCVNGEEVNWAHKIYNSRYYCL